MQDLIVLLTNTWLLTIWNSLSLIQISFRDHAADPNWMGPVLYPWPFFFNSGPSDIPVLRDPFSSIRSSDNWLGRVESMNNMYSHNSKLDLIINQVGNLNPTPNAKRSPFLLGLFVSCNWFPRNSRTSCFYKWLTMNDEKWISKDHKISSPLMEIE